METVEILENIGLIEKGSLDRSMKEIKEQTGGFIGTLLAGLAGSLLPALFGQAGSGLLEDLGVWRSMVVVYYSWSIASLVCS